MGEWSFLTNHARSMLFIASHPDARLRDLADALDVTERTAFGIVADLTEAGYVVKERDGRRNRYHIQGHLPLRDSIGRERTIGEVLELLAGTAPHPEHSARSALGAVKPAGRVATTGRGERNGSGGSPRRPKTLVPNGDPHVP